MTLLTAPGGEYKAKQNAGTPQVHLTFTPEIKCVDYRLLCCSAMKLYLKQSFAEDEVNVVELFDNIHFALMIVNYDDYYH